MAATLEAQVLPKQMQFLTAAEREVLYSGAFGAGKTRALCWKLVIRASHPGAIELLVRKTNVALKRSTLKTLLEPDGDLPPVLPPGTYTHNKSQQTIRIWGGGEIMYFGMDDPNKIGSTPATGVAIDEATELTEKDYTALRGRIRVKVKGLPRQIYSATNPGAPSHHLAQRFGLASDSEAAPDTKVITTRTADNFFLPADYVADLNTFSGVARKRYVEGLWVAAEGLVYPEMLNCVVAHSEPPLGLGDYEDVGGIDFGWTAPFCALQGRIYTPDDGMPVLYVYAERYEREISLADHGAALMKSPHGRDAIWAADPEDPEAIRDLQTAGLRVVKAKKGIKLGIGAVNGLISSGRLFISDQCTNLLREAETYAYPEDSEAEKPVKGFDHAMDALRYMVMMVRRRRLIEWMAEAVEATREES